MNVEVGVCILKVNWVVRMGMKSCGVIVYGCMFDMVMGKVIELGLSFVGVKFGGVVFG